MEGRLTFEYDPVGDILYVGKGKPYSGQESTELAFGVVARSHPQSGEIENLEILFFKQRIERGEELQLPIEADLRRIKAA
jgi:hypothetical protein